MVDVSHTVLYIPAIGTQSSCRFGDNHLRAVWRLSLGLGIIPAAAVFIWRLKMEEPSHFKKNAMNRGSTPGDATSHYIQIFCGLRGNIQLE